MANLSIRLVNDFPEYAEMFNITEYINSAEDLEQKTSTIQQNIKGVKGSKTGYIKASGYNIAMWGDYEFQGEDGKQKTDHIFAVLIGAQTRQERDELMLKLLSSTIKNNFNSPKNIKQSAKNYNEEISSILKFFGLKPEKYMSNRPKKRGEGKKYDYYDYINDEEYDEDFELPIENDRQKKDEDLDKNLKNMINVRDKNDVNNNVDNQYEEGREKFDNNEKNNDEFMDTLKNSTERNDTRFNLSMKSKNKNRFYIVK